MRSVAPERWDDLALALLLGIIAVPRLILAVVRDRPLGVEGTLSIACVVLALLIVGSRIRR